MTQEPLRRPLPADRIGPSDTALLVIDMERDFVDAGAVQETPGALAIVPAINRLIGWARDHGYSFGQVMGIMGVGQLIAASLAYRYYPETAHVELEALNPDDPTISEN